MVLLALALSLLLPICLTWFSGKSIVPALCSSCIWAAGFTLICLQILLLVGFQAIYGYIYHELSLVLAAFMVGLAVGGLLSIRERRADRRDYRLLLLVQAALAIVGIAIYAAFEWWVGAASEASAFLIGTVCFPLLALFCGGLGGFQFAVAGRIFFSEDPTVRGFGLGWLYGIDLLGACMGALIFSAYLLPVFGFFKTTILIGCLNAGPVAWAAAGILRKR
jgi:spermidine synthase